MKVKRFTAPDMAQAMRQVRKALGPEAVILATGRLPGGGVEITAAIEPGQAPAAAGAPVAGAPGPEGEGDLAELTRQVRGLSDLVARHLVHSEAAQGFAGRPELVPIHRHLRQQEVAPELIALLLDDLAAPGGGNLLGRLAIRLKKLLNVYPGPGPAQARPAIWALVGPTGVGKTTTVAKLAASHALRHRLRVGMITLDTFRIAAAEQLMVYGRIMDLETRVAASPEQYAQAVAGMAGADLILVDTVGRSPRDGDNLEELRTILAAVPATVCHLVLACPTRDADLQATLDGFGRFDPRSLIFTKLDETDAYGVILNQVTRSGRPVSFLTSGQRVPDDLETATREGLARRLMPPRGEPRVAA